MNRSLRPLLLLGLCCGVAQAGIDEGGNPPGLHIQHLSGAVHVRGLVSQLKLTDRRGRSTTVALPRPYRLDEALPLPSGDWADLTLLLEEPVWVEVAGGAPSRLAVAEITLALDDPGAAWVRLDWSLPDPTSATLRAGRSVPGLVEALADGAIARSAALTD